MTTIFEHDIIKVNVTGRDHGFIAIIDNKSDGQICIHYDKPGYNDDYDPILVAPNDWIGLLADDEGRDWLKAIENNQIYIVTGDDEIDYYPTGCSMTLWNEECKEITAEVEKILNEYNLYDHDRKTNIFNLNQLLAALEILKNIK